MPPFVRTPEALLGRNDSKNPATTCRGITTSGRPCRRGLPLAALSSMSNRRDSTLDGVIAIVQHHGEIQEADFFCWQHKDQAEQAANDPSAVQGSRLKRRPTKIIPLRERSSVDTLFQRLGVEDAVSEVGGQPKHTRRSDHARPSRETRSDHDRYVEKKYLKNPPRNHSKPKKQGFWASLCCIQEEGDDGRIEVVRYRRRQTVDQTDVLSPSRHREPRPRQQPISNVRGAGHAPTSSLGTVPRRPMQMKQHRTTSNSQTQQLLTLIPQHLSPQTTSALLAELIKPISPHDEEGYIYIFWLTSQNTVTPPDPVARSLLTTPTRPSHQGRRISDVLTEYSYDGTEPDTSGKKTIGLKIGRANNVTRRMNEWQRQCGYALNLVRWYPYVPGSSTPSPQPSPGVRQSLYPDLSARPQPSSRRESEGVRKIPCVKRVERLIHLELADKQVKSRCGTCAKEHREWFEVAASQAEVREVDACVRRWVEWAEKQSEDRNRDDDGPVVPYC